ESRPAPLESRPAPAAPAAADETIPPGRSLTNKERNELKSIESKIEAAEADLAAVEVKLADPSLYTERMDIVPTLVAEQAAIKERINELYARWEELETIKAGR